MKTYSLMIGSVGLIVLLFLSFAYMHRATPAPQEKNTFIIIGGTNIPVELARTPAELEGGLSYRPSLDPKQGMLFIFQKPDLYQFWMPHMNFPIDIIWINEDNTIVAISENATPLKDMNKPTYYTPPTPAKYVLEVNAHFSVTHNIKIGHMAIFQNIEH